jgi:hypothetical protein
LVYIRESINRAAVVVKPGKPFLDWLHGADPTSQKLTLADLQREPTVYLVPEYVEEHEVLTFIAEKVMQIFEEHLDGWYRVPEAWPAVRDLQTFQQWFEYSVHSQVVDLCDYLIEYEEW